MTGESRNTASPTGRPGKKILMFFPMVPYPLREHGVSIRYFPVIEHLSKTHTLDLVLFHPRPVEEERLKVLRQLCRDVSVFRNPRYLPHGTVSKLATYARYGVPWTAPVSFVAHGGSDIERIIREQSGKDRYDVLLWVGAFLLPHLMSVMPLESVGRVLVDFIDSPSLIGMRWKREANRTRLPWHYELWKTIRWEGKVIREMDETLYISEVDSRTVPAVLTPGRRRRVIPNGVDFGSYTPGTIGGIASPSIGFLGNMAYQPNIEAASWLFEQVYVPLKRQIADLSLVLIGRNPLEPIRKLREHPGVTVTGAIEDIWPHVNSVDLFVFPLWTGTGLKNKILESMFAGRPVITTPIGNEGIDAVHGRDIVICRDSAQFRKETARLLESPEERRRLGGNARDFVRNGFSWPPILENFEQILTGEQGPSPGDAGPAIPVRE